MGISLKISSLIIQYGLQYFPWAYKREHENSNTGIRTCLVYLPLVVQ